MNIPTDTVGAVLNSVKPGHRIRVVDDSGNTGGFLVYEWWEGSDGPDEFGGFDSWVQDEDSLQRLFAEAGWLVSWSALSGFEPPSIRGD
jgi:hypothetical protein